MKKKLFIAILKVISTILLIYSLFMILFISIFDLLSLSIFTDFWSFTIERIVPNLCSVIALILLIRHIWISSKKIFIQRKEMKEFDRKISHIFEWYRFRFKLERYYQTKFNVTVVSCRHL